ncbi:MAG TPA: hypothetical protein VGT08_11935 [Terracidiphilus sp.]|nr:hypothetical protein [Terracidiphilus sp.]
MNKRLWSVSAWLCGLLVLTVCAVPSGAQTTEVKEKPPMFSYVGNWQIPRAHWADMEKSASARNALMEKAMANGTIVGYGEDINLVHTADGWTHDTWWSAMSMAGLVKVLDQLMTGETSASPNAASPTKHYDLVFVSRYYNWKPGAYKGGYVHVSVYKLKADAPDDALDLLAQHLFVPNLEKLLADGTIVEYEIDTNAIHTSAPGTFAIVYVSPTPEGLDTVQAAIRASAKAHPLSVDAFGSFTDDNGHRDELAKGNGVFK